MKRALLTGVTGQDGSYLAEFLIEKGYEVHGVIRRSSVFGTQRIEHLYRDPHQEQVRLFLHYGDLTDSTALNRILRKVRPDEIYNLGAQSHVRVSFDIPEYTADVTGLGAVRLLDAILDTGIDTRYYQASSSEIFGNASEIPQSETTPLEPRSPYACAKAFAYWTTINYREAYGLHASNGVLFNHESPRRGETFLTRKVTRGVARIVARKQEALYLGNLDAKRDWGYAGDYVEAMWRMLQEPQGGDYVVATGESHTVRDFVARAFGLVGLDWQAYVHIDPRYFRPTEVEHLEGDATKARKALGWAPKVSFDALVEMMLRADLALEGLQPSEHIRPRPQES